MGTLEPIQWIGQIRNQRSVCSILFIVRNEGSKHSFNLSNKYFTNFVVIPYFYEIFIHSLFMSRVEGH